MKAKLQQQIFYNYRTNRFFIIWGSHFSGKLGTWTTQANVRRLERTPCVYIGDI